jgi:hypothetical protein
MMLLLLLLLLLLKMMMASLMNSLLTLELRMSMTKTFPPKLRSRLHHV